MSPLILLRCSGTRFFWGVLGALGVWIQDLPGQDGSKQVKPGAEAKVPGIGFRTKPAGGGIRDLLQPMQSGGAEGGGASAKEGMSPRKNPEAQRLFDRAVDAFRRGDLEAAGRDFRKVLELSPSNPSATVNLGLVEYRRRKYGEARQLLTRLVRWQPENGLGWLLLGMVEYESDRIEPAFAALAQAVLYAPKDAKAHHFLGAVLGAKGWYSGAEAEMRRAVELDPEYAEAHFNLAVFYLQRTPPALELARRHYVRARELGTATDSGMEKTFAGEGALPSPGAVQGQ
jgi:tetratricopeptide (TPR) repeat protein